MPLQAAGSISFTFLPVVGSLTRSLHANRYLSLPLLAARFLFFSSTPLFLFSLHLDDDRQQLATALLLAQLRQLAAGQLVQVALCREAIEGSGGGSPRRRLSNGGDCSLNQKTNIQCFGSGSGSKWRKDGTRIRIRIIIDADQKH